MEYVKFYRSLSLPSSHGNNLGSTAERKLIFSASVSSATSLPRIAAAIAQSRFKLALAAESQAAIDPIWDRYKAMNEEISRLHDRPLNDGPKLPAQQPRAARPCRSDIETKTPSSAATQAAQHEKAKFVAN